MNISKKSKTMRFLEEVMGETLTLGGMIRSIRLCDEVNQPDFAEKLEISTSHLCDIEKGRKFLSPERAAHFAKILGYSEEQFVRLALQGILDHSGMKMTVFVKAA